MDFTATHRHDVRAGLRLLLLCLLASLAACSPYKFAGDQIMKFSEKVIVPHELAGGDLGIGCHAATAFAAPGMAFEGVGTDIDQVSVLLLLTSGVCSEIEAVESELTFLRAMHAQTPLPGQDARIAQKRALALAARREYAAYLRFVKHFGEPHEGQCPEFKSDFEQLVFMVGLLSGIQALVNDAQTGQLISVPRDIAPTVGHMVECLDNEKWWDLPLGVRAALWYTVPMLAPPDVNAMEIMERVARRGERDGVRLGYVIWAMAVMNGGDMATTRRAIREFAAAGEHMKPSPRYRILDAISAEVMLAVSDRIWTEQVGHRTPMNALGTFPDDPPKYSIDRIEDLIGP